MLKEKSLIAFREWLEKLKTMWFKDYVVRNWQLVYSVNNVKDLLDPKYWVFAFACEHNLIKWDVYGETKITMDNLGKISNFSKDGEYTYLKAGLFSIIASLRIGYDCCVEDFIMENINIWEKVKDSENGFIYVVKD